MDRDSARHQPYGCAICVPPLAQNVVFTGKTTKLVPPRGLTTTFWVFLRVASTGQNWSTLGKSNKNAIVARFRSYRRPTLPSVAVPYVCQPNLGVLLRSANAAQALFPWQKAYLQKHGRFFVFLLAIVRLNFGAVVRLQEAAEFCTYSYLDSFTSYFGASSTQPFKRAAREAREQAISHSQLCLKDSALGSQIRRWDAASLAETSKDSGIKMN